MLIYLLLIHLPEQNIAGSIARLHWDMPVTALSSLSAQNVSKLRMNTSISTVLAALDSLETLPTELGAMATLLVSPPGTAWTLLLSDPEPTDWGQSPTDWDPDFSTIISGLSKTKELEEE